MSSKHRILLIESDNQCLAMLTHAISRQFPHVKVHAVTPKAAIHELETSDYDIIICDSYLMHDDSISFISDLCRMQRLCLIVITGDTDIKLHTFSPLLSESCIHAILYKPLDLQTLFSSILSATLLRKPCSE